MSEINHARIRITEDFDPVHPDDDIRCKDCAFRELDLVIDGRVAVKGYTGGHCSIYEDELKPTAILFNHADCEYYEKDEDE